MNKNFQPFGEKMSENRRGDFLTHSVHAKFRSNRKILLWTDGLTAGFIRSTPDSE